MPTLRRPMVALSLALCVNAGPALAQPAATGAPGAADATAAAAARSVNAEGLAAWRDFIHYTRIARPDLAADAAKRLDSVSDEQLLDIVENSEYAQDYERTVERAKKTEGLSDAATKLEARIAGARVAKARETARIGSDIQHLGGAIRERQNAIARLRAAGQFAAPQLLTALIDEKQMRLHPYIMEAMVQIGRPMVDPLTVALPQLGPVAQGDVIQVLSEIGYPRALPAIRRVIEDKKTDPAARGIAQIAFRRIAQQSQVPDNTSATDLYLTLAQNLYTAVTNPAGATELPGYDPASRKGIIWEFHTDTGLIPIEVPTEIYGDALALRAAKDSLVLDPSNDQALSTWLMANLRRENRLPQGASDPSYSKDLQPPAFYLKAAGPLRQHDVLARALGDGDTALARDAIAALAATATTEALVNKNGVVQPLVTALSFPDRRVRYEAAFAATNARPNTPFSGSDRIVPVLAEAVRQSAGKLGIVIAPTDTAQNTLADLLKSQAGFTTVIGSTSLTDKKIVDVLDAVPGVEAIVVQDSPDHVSDVVAGSSHDYKLAGVPVIVVTSTGEKPDVYRRLGDTNRRVTVVTSPQDLKALDMKSAVSQAMSAYSGTAISAEEANNYAETSLRLLREIALARSDVFKVSEAQTALIGALKDTRVKIVTGAAAVLSLINSQDAQRAVFDAAMNDKLDEATRITLLGSLAESATYYGSKIDEPRSAKLLALVKSSSGDMAQAAARAHGALTLPTSNVVQLITK